MGKYSARKAERMADLMEKGLIGLVCAIAGIALLLVVFVSTTRQESGAAERATSAPGVVAPVQ